jgi:hypothetical protein
MQEKIISFKNKPMYMAKLSEEVRDGKPFFKLCVTKLSTNKMIINFNYLRLERAKEDLEKFENGIVSKEIEEKARKNNNLQKLIEFKNKLKIGDVLYDSWGYEQTNVDFYIIKSINSNKSKIVIQEIGHVEVSDTHQANGMSCNVLPDVNKSIGEEIVKNIRSERIKICDSVSLKYWDGRPLYKSWYY